MNEWFWAMVEVVVWSIIAVLLVAWAFSMGFWVGVAVVVFLGWGSRRIQI
jgi:uncharacterized membrane protein